MHLLFCQQVLNDYNYLSIIYLAPLISSCNIYIFSHAIVIYFIMQYLYVYFIMQYLYILSCNIYIFHHAIFIYFLIFPSFLSLPLIFPYFYFLCLISVFSYYLLPYTVSEILANFAIKKYMTHSDIRNSTFATKTFGND